MITLKLFVCTDHAGYWPVGTASVVLAQDEAAARSLLDDALANRNLATSEAVPYTLHEVSMTDPLVLVLRDGDY